jgi:RND superfamily putative drug exporter
VALIFLGVVAALAILAVAVPDHLKVAGFDTPNSQSSRATARLHGALGYDPEPGMVVLARSKQSFRVPAARAALGAVASQLTRDPGVGQVQTPYGPGGDDPLLLSHDGRGALVLVHFRKVGEEVAAPVINRIRAHVRSAALTLQYDGFDVGFLDDNRVVRQDLLRAELIAFPLLALLLVGIFRGLAASTLPLAIGGLSVLGTFAGLRLLSQVMNVSVYALNLALALGLGLAVDYGLFLVSRYREESARRGPGTQAVRATMSTAGRAVLYSGATVAGACAALLFFPQPFIYSMGIGGVLTALLSAATALLVVPPLLPLVGHRPQTGRWLGGHRAGRESDPSTSWWYRFSHWVMWRAIPVAVVAAALLVAAAVPATHLKSTFLDSKALPPGLQSRTVADAIATDFVPHLDFPISVAVPPPLARPSPLAALEERIAALPGAALVSEAQRAGDGSALLQVLPTNEPLSTRSQGLVRDLRRLDARLLVGGRIADFVDLKASIRTQAPPALALVTVLTLIVFFLLTDSVVLPIKALLMNSLTLFAVFGLLVAIFQDRLLGIAALIGFNGPRAIETSISVVVIGVTLGLATDYSILLLSRIKEAHDEGERTEEAVALGLERSGRVITNAALLQAVALLALVSSRVFLVQELALGLALGVAIDASVVRACLVPALMRILGQINWWAPRSVHRLHARLDASAGVATGWMARRRDGPLPGDG